jgi:hypothetical protein
MTFLISMWTLSLERKIVDHLGRYLRSMPCNENVPNAQVSMTQFCNELCIKCTLCGFIMFFFLKNHICTIFFTLFSQLVVDADLLE